MDKQKVTTSQINGVIEDLILKISQEQQRNFKEITEIIAQLGRWCRTGRDDGTRDGVSKPVVIQCFVKRPEATVALVTMIGDICTGESQNNIIKYNISYNAAYCAMLAYDFLRIITDASDVILKEAAKAGIVHTMLKMLNVLKSDLGRLKVSNLELLTTAIFGLIQNFAKQEFFMYFKFTKFIEILSAYLSIDDKEVYFMCLITLASLVEIITNKNLNILSMSTGEISSLVEILCEASTEHDLTARKIYGSLVVPVEDMLRIIKALCHIEANGAIIKEHISMILMSTELCINNGTDDHVPLALDLLWTLISKLSISSDDLAQNASTLSTSLNYLSMKKDKPAIYLIALCILHTLTPTETKDATLLLSLSEGAYKYGRYNECIRWSEFLFTNAQNDSARALAKLLSGKSYFHIYRRKQQLFQEVLPELSPKEFHLQNNSVFSDAKRAIIDLGDAFEIDLSVVDEEGLRFLDISIIDLVCHTNGLKDIGRCLLCQKKCKLLRSHLCPDAVLRAFATGLPETNTKRVFNTSFFKTGESKSPHTIVKWLFCQKCEEILSRDGEAHFIPKFFHKVYGVRNYQEPSEQMVIDYGEWLYHFALGIVFRSLVNEAITSFQNEDEIYTLFIHCRKLLLTKNLFEDCEKPCIYLLVSPNLPSTDAGFIANLHNAPFVFALTNKCLKTGNQTLHAHFLLSRIGIFNFLVLFKPAKKALIPSECIIHPQGGKYTIPVESSREKLIPKGITSVLDGLAVASQKNFLEIDETTARILLRTHDTSDREIPPSELAKQRYGILPAIDHDLGKLGDDFLNCFSPENPQSINLLPEGMEIDYFKDSIILPENHFVVLHGTFEGKSEKQDSYKGTLFLVSTGNPQEPCVLLICIRPGLTVSLGFVVSPDTLCPIRLLKDQNPKRFLPYIAKHLNASASIKKALPHFMKMNGLKTYHTVIHHSYLKWTVTYDLVCEKRCWYCKQRCNNCLRPSFSSYNISHPRMPLLKFCGTTCQETYSLGRVPSAPILNESAHLMLLNINVPMELRLSGFSYACIGVFLGDGSKTFPRRDAYVVYQHRAPFSQTFLEYFLADDFSISRPLKYYNEEDAMEVLQSSESTLHKTFIELALQAELKRVKIKNLKDLIDEKLKVENQV